MQRVLVTVKKHGKKYEAALIVDNKFQHTGEGDDLYEAVVPLMAPFFGSDHADGIEAAVEFSLLTPDEVARAIRREARQRQTAEAAAEAAELEALNAALARERAAVAEAERLTGGANGS